MLAGDWGHVWLRFDSCDLTSDSGENSQTARFTNSKTDTEASEFLLPLVSWLDADLRPNFHTFMPWKRSFFVFSFLTALHFSLSLPLYVCLSVCLSLSLSLSLSPPPYLCASKTSSVCISTAVYCPDPAAPTNGARQPAFSLFHVSNTNRVTFTCNAGYELVGSRVSNCQADGTWSHNLPTCRRKGYYFTYTKYPIWLCLHVSYTLNSHKAALRYASPLFRIDLSCTHTQAFMCVTLLLLKPLESTALQYTSLLSSIGSGRKGGSL